MITAIQSATTLSVFSTPLCVLAGRDPVGSWDFCLTGCACMIARTHDVSTPSYAHANTWLNWYGATESSMDS